MKRPSASHRRRSRKLRVEPLEFRRLLAADWLHNVELPEDVNGSQLVTPADALLVVNHLNYGSQAVSAGAVSAEGEAGSGTPVFLDVDNNQIITPTDALLVVNRLNDPSAHAEDPSDEGSATADNAQNTGEDQNPDDGDVTETELKARLSGAGSEHGEAEYESETEHGQTEREFEVELEDAVPDSTFDVYVDDVLVGQLTVDSLGRGSLKYASSPDGAGELPFPDDFPGPVVDGSTVRVGDVAAGTLLAEVGDTDDGGAQDGQHSEMELKARLAGEGTEHGEAEYEQGSEHGQSEREFEVEVEDAVPDTTLDVFVNDVLAGQLTVDSLGRGGLKYSSSPEGADELPFPDDFPEVAEGSTVRIGDVAAGTLKSEPGDAGGTDDGGARDGQHSEMELKARLASEGTEHGEAEYEQGTEHGQSEREFELEVEDAVPDTTFDVFVGDVRVGQISVDAKGAGRLRFSTSTDDGDSQPFPADFPEIAEGTAVRVGDTMRGQFGREPQGSDD